MPVGCSDVRGVALLLDRRRRPRPTTSTTPCAYGVVDGVDDGQRRRRARPSVPKLMLIASAPWSTAQTIDAATLESLKSDLIDQELAAEPGAGEPDAVVARAAHASDATCVPWPIVVEARGRARGVDEVDGPRRARRARGGRSSTPVSMTATVAPGAVADVPRLREAAARRPPLDRRAGGRVRRGLRRRSAGSLGWKRSARAALGRHGATRGSARSRRASACSDSPGRGRTVTSRICGTLKPLGRAPAAAATACTAAARAAAWPVAAAGLSVTSSRPVPSGTAAWAWAGRTSPRISARRTRRIVPTITRARGPRIGNSPMRRRGSGIGRRVSSEAERELRVLAHLVRRPRRREDHGRRRPSSTLVELADELLDLLGDLRADRAAGRW